ncbi:oxaloacetate decarboxylase alpha subunit [Microbacterium ginsengiterrae]|uniref:Oxaloacetate decarboxylase alpha subunit n=1 Tax=Microbacterium ginsengiterrae TaxID=546115 RepID=A0A7W9CD88_9MICO|nr:pyruvate/oxaloacetate carboxyltransferase [Microbacterium ginsengiterrae]MBB5743162.1 oxaloacetate decarboxylase alpha subunit [Microbacterium ginsengiterrae]
MTDVELVDVSIRDGNQSMWGAVGMTTRMIAGAAPDLNKVGYRAIETASSTILAMAVRTHKEDPWEMLRTAKRLMPDTPLGFLTTGKRFITFYRTPDVLFELAFRLLVRNGVSRLWVIDPMHDMAGARRIARMAKDAGFTDVVGGICYTTSPVHTDEYYADRIAELDDCDAIDSIYLKDPAGLMTPERLRGMVPMLQGRLSRLRLDEIHSHATTGVSPLTLLEAADLGMTKLHTALPPLANGSSHPSALTMVRNLRARGHSVDVDVEAMERASAYWTRQAQIKRLPAGVPREYDEDYYRHTIPGGVQSTLARQLREMGRPELFDAVVEESVAVRRDLGWPIVMTPFAQYIVTQATLNVITGERYKQLSDEVIDLLRGDFGPLPGDVDQNLMDRAMTTARGKLPPSDGSSEETLEQMRARFGGVDDEELLLRAVMPAEQVDAMQAARGTGAASALASLLKAVENRPQLNVAFSQGDAKFALTRPGGTA